MTQIDPKQEKMVAEVRAWVPQRIRGIRTAKGFTQQSLANSMGVHFSRVCDFEKNGSDYKASTVFRAARALNVSMDQVFRGCPGWSKQNPDAERVTVVSESQLVKALLASGLSGTSAASVAKMAFDSLV